MADDSELVERVGCAISDHRQKLRYGRVMTAWGDSAMAESFRREQMEFARVAIAEVQRWRPIEEAPKIECRRLWLWQRGRGGYEGWWHDFGPDGQNWQDDSDSEPAPTHWQPRPAPPQ